MSKWLIYLFSMLAGLVLSFAQLPDWLIPFWPSWLLLISAYWMVRLPQSPTLLMSFIAGLCLDAGFNTLLGEHVIALLVPVYLISRLRLSIDINPWWQTTISLIPIWCVYLLLLTIGDHLSMSTSSILYRWSTLLPTTLLWPVLQYLFNRITPETVSK